MLCDGYHFDYLLNNFDSNWCLIVVYRSYSIRCELFNFTHEKAKKTKIEIINQISLNVISHFNLINATVGNVYQFFYLEKIQKRN